MHLRIYLWLSCVVLAGYVQATEEAAQVDAGVADPVSQGEGALASDRSLFIDDEGSGLEPDESSGSGWGPGPDDEDARGSGDQAPEDDEDFEPRGFSKPMPVPTTTEDTSDTEPPILPKVILQPDLIIPRIATDKQPGEGAGEARGAGEEQPSRPDQTDISISGDDLNPGTDLEQSGSNIGSETRPVDNVVFIMNAKPEDRATSFFAQPGILAAVIGGAVVGLLCAILVVMFIVYRMRKKDEGSYALDEPKRSPAAGYGGAGAKAAREFYA